MKRKLAECVNVLKKDNEQQLALSDKRDAELYDTRVTLQVGSCKLQALQSAITPGVGVGAAALLHLIM